MTNDQANIQISYYRSAKSYLCLQYK